MKSYSISQRKKSRGNMTWYGRTFEDGLLVSEVSLKTTRRSDARAWLDAMNAARFLPEAILRTGRPTEDREIDSAVSMFLESVSGSHGPSSATYRAYRSRLSGWVEWCNVERVTTLRGFTRETAARYCGETCSVDAPKTARERIRLLRQFFSWCDTTYELGGYDPMKGVKPPRPVKRAKAFWNPEEIDRILDAAPTPEFRLYWALMAFAGLRRAEAFAFGPSSIVDGKIRVVGKGNKEAFVPIGRRLSEELSRVELREGMFSTQRYIKPDRSGATLKRAVARAGLPNLDATNHKFRHSFASNLIRSGVNVKAVQQLMRHENVQVTLDTYSHLLQEDLQASADML